MKLRLGVVLLLVATVHAAAPEAARSATAARTLYARALDRERALREQDGASLEQLRGLAETYEAIARRFPASAYSDNALWQGGNIALLAFDRFGQAADRRTAERLLNQLRRSYPASSLIGQIDQVLGRTPDAARSAGPVKLSKPLARVEPRVSWPVALMPETGRPLPTAADAPDLPVQTAGMARLPGSESDAAGGTVPVVGSGTVSIRDIKRTSIEGGVRVTIEMDGESSYHAERLERPRRVFFDLKDTRPVPALLDATLKFDDEVVREVRLGRHPKNTTRVVFDMQGVDSYSVFTLYNPFRMVIDFKTGASGNGPTTRSASTSPKSAPAELPTVPVVSALPAPSVSAPVAAPKAPREPVDAPVKPIPSRALSAPALITPEVPSANADGKFSLSRQLGLSVSRIVIDAGHGGHDPGAQATGITESELTLDVALRLSKLLEKQPGVDVVMTRDTDVFIPLEERTAIANREGADLFLSIHANASRTPTARGVETYFLNFASNPEASAVAARENSASARAMHSLPEIVRAIALNDKIDESRDFAEMVQHSMVHKLATRNKLVRDLGVKQAPFVVLIGAAMPSVLAEISFVTNKQEGQLLKTGAYRQQIAEALFDAVLRYQQSLKKWKSGAVGVGSR
jgi:N-acetylmuramoyl-L-alanine amidase